MQCPHCGARLTPDLSNCVGCGWKVRLSEILVQPLQSTRPAYLLPASDIYYLFADQFLEPATSAVPLSHAEVPIIDRTPVRKEALAMGLCRVAFIWLATSGHISLRVSAAGRPFNRLRTVLAIPMGPYRAPTGSLECLILDSLYDRRQGLSVDETMLKLIGFWYQADAGDWVLRVVKQHLLASPYSRDGRHIPASELPRLEPQIAELRGTLDNFALAQPALVTTLWESIRRGLESKRG